jgi:hypothetical protein
VGTWLRLESSLHSPLQSSDICNKYACRRCSAIISSLGFCNRSSGGMPLIRRMSIMVF